MKVGMRNISELKIHNGTNVIADDESINKLEDAVGCKLPQTYREFLKEVNGGHPELDTYFSEDSGWAVDTFFAVCAALGQTESIEWNYQHKGTGAPKSFLPFGCDGGGNLFCIDTDLQDSSPVYCCYHDTNPVTIEKICDSFSEFIDGLSLNPDYI
jgi:hypothetical protein